MDLQKESLKLISWCRQASLCGSRRIFHPQAGIIFARTRASFRGSFLPMRRRKSAVCARPATILCSRVLKDAAGHSVSRPFFDAEPEGCEDERCSQGRYSREWVRQRSTQNSGTSHARRISWLFVASLMRICQGSVQRLSRGKNLAGLTSE